jgi:hypothetical protein
MKSRDEKQGLRRHKKQGWEAEGIGREKDGEWRAGG